MAAFVGLEKGKKTAVFSENLPTHLPKAEPVLEPVESRITQTYRIAKRKLLKLEAKHLATPTTEFANEIIETRGFLAGLQKGLDIVAAKRNDQELPFGEI